jgi:putative SOS response-associated peptidase YedK
MCTRYASPEARNIESLWRIGRHNPWRGGQMEIFPSYQGPFIRAARDSPEPDREIVTGQWNLIPWFAESPKLKYATSNARSEELASKVSYKNPWASWRSLAGLRYADSSGRRSPFHSLV